MNFATFFILFLNVESFVFMTKPVKTRVLTLMDNCKNETYIKPSILLLMEVKDLYVNDWMEGEVVWDIDVGVDVGVDDKKEENADYITPTGKKNETIFTKKIINYPIFIQ